MQAVLSDVQKYSETLNAARTSVEADNVRAVRNIFITNCSAVRP